MVVGGASSSFGDHQCTRTSLSCRKSAVRGGCKGTRNGGNDMNECRTWSQSTSWSTTTIMSRETQPTRRTRTPSISNPLPNPLNYPTILPTTRPLQIARPSTPSNTTFSSSSSTSPKAPPFPSPNRPHRPQRSDLRPRQPSDYSASERTSTSSRIVNDLTRERRDSTSTTLSDASIQHRPLGSTSLPTKPRLDPPRSATSELSVSPLPSTAASTALSAAMAAFREAGEANFRRREPANGYDEDSYELERRSEVEREKVRQERIKERMPHRKPTAKARTGEIDGESETLLYTVPRPRTTAHVMYSYPGPDQR